MNYKGYPEKLKERERNEVHLIGQLSKMPQSSKRMNNEDVITFVIENRSYMYHGFKYEKFLTKHNILARDPVSMAALEGVELSDWIEVFGHLTYTRTRNGVNAIIIASLVVYREDLASQVSLNARGKEKHKPDRCGLSEVTDCTSEMMDCDEDV